MAEDTATLPNSQEMSYVFFRHFDDVEGYPLTDSMLLVIGIVIAYLLFVLKIGPDHMKNREPYKLKNILLLYNAFQVIVSAYYVYLACEIMSLTGILPRVCSDKDPAVRSKMSYCIYVYWLGKITELLDTVFFVLRKKYNQVTFLHVYHHASVVFFTYLLFLYGQSSAIIFFLFCNSFVHVVMYFYYGLSGLGPGVAKYLFWKKYITNMQRVQFVVIFFHQLISFFYTVCEQSIYAFLYIETATPIFFYLFTRFYHSSYEKKQEEKK